MSFGIDPNAVLSGTLGKIVVALVIAVLAALAAWFKKTVLGRKIVWSSVARVDVPSSVQSSDGVGGVARVWLENRRRNKAERISLITSASVVAVRIDPVLDYELSDLDDYKVIKIDELPKRSKFAIDLFGKFSSPHVRSVRLDGDEIVETRFEKIAGADDVVMPPWYVMLFWMSVMALIVQIVILIVAGVGILPEVETTK